MKVLIAGAGIGGLTAAIALQRSGIDVQVFERAPQLLEVGAGISLWPNAVKVLDQLGVGDALRVASVASYKGGIHTERGELLVATETGEIVGAFGAPILILHRADLLEILHRAADPARVRLGAAIERFEQDGDSIRVCLADGQHVRGDLLIGADGIRSVVRAQLFPDVVPQYAGQIAWRGVTEFAAPRDAAYWGETWGPGRRFGLLPIGGARVYWFATRNAATPSPDDPTTRKGELLRLFGAWHAPIAELITSTVDASILRNDISDLPPLPTWSQGRVTLLGDAAHATTPNLGQGGCQAIEDALVLARALRHTARLDDALRKYESQRIGRANMITAMSRRVGAMGNWEHPLACWLRNRLAASTPRWARMRMLRPIVGFEA